MKTKIEIKKMEPKEKKLSSINYKQQLHKSNSKL